MNENKEPKMVSRTIAIALGVVCVVLAAGLIVAATNGSLFISDAQTITDLQEQISNQTSQISTLSSQNTILTNQLSAAKSNSSTLADEVATLTSQVSDYESVLTMNESEIAIDSQTFAQDANATTSLYEGTINYAGYATIEVTASSNTTYVQVTYSCGDLDFDETITVGTSGTAIFPILPGALTVTLGNTDTVANNATATMTYYY